MRVLFLEAFPMWIYGLPNGFVDAGHEVLVSGPLVESELPKLLDSFKPDLIVSLGWTSENTGEKVDWIAKYVRPTKIPYIFWATEEPGYTEVFSLPFIRKVQPDFIFTICRRNIEFYRGLGYGADYLDFGHHDSVHCRVAPINKYRARISLVANAYPEYMAANPDCYRRASVDILLVPLLKKRIRVDLWGHGWEKMEDILGVDIPEQWIHGYLPYTEANKVYSSSDIMLGLQNEQITQRTYEILGSEGLLLTNGSKPIKQAFHSGQDLLISNSPQETLMLVNYYLSHPDARARLRRRGRLAVQKDSYKQRASYIVDVLKKNKVLEAGLK